MKQMNLENKIISKELLKKLEALSDKTILVIQVDNKVLEYIQQEEKIYEKTISELINEKFLKKVNESGKIDIDLLVNYPKLHEEQNNFLKLLKDFVKFQKDAMIPINEVFEEMRVRGYSKEKTQELLLKLKTRGEVYEPRVGYFKITSQIRT